jgi:hypothetical protein
VFFVTIVFLSGAWAKVRDYPQRFFQRTSDEY